MFLCVLRLLNQHSLHKMAAYEIKQNPIQKLIKAIIVWKYWILALYQGLIQYQSPIQ